METVTIRAAAAQDAEFLFRLMNEPSVLHILHEVPTVQRDWEEAVSAWSEDADEEGYILFSGGQPAGWFAVNGLKAGNHGAFLKMAVLLPAYQGRRIGRHALAMILKDLKSRGITVVRLFTDQSNLAAQRCYAKCGFVVEETLSERMSDGATVERYKMVCHL